MRVICTQSEQHPLANQIIKDHVPFALTLFKVAVKIMQLYSNHMYMYDSIEACWIWCSWGINLVEKPLVRTLLLKIFNMTLQNWHPGISPDSKTLQTWCKFLFSQMVWGAASSVSRSSWGPTITWYQNHNVSRESTDNSVIRMWAGGVQTW